MKKREDKHTDWSDIFNADRLHIGDVIEYTTALPGINQGVRAQGKFEGPYQGTIFEFHFPDNTVGVKLDDQSPSYYVYNGPWRTDIVRVVSRKKKEK